MVNVQSIQVVGDAHLDFIQLIKDIELRDGQAVKPVNFYGVPTDHAVKPTAPPTASGGGAKFSSSLAEMIIETSLQFGWKWTFPYPSGVGLGDADDPIDERGTHSSTSTGPP